MYKIKYEEYYFDSRRYNRTESFYSLDQFEDWIFSQMQRKYDGNMFFPTPESLERIHADGPGRIEFRPRPDGPNIWIHLVQGSDGRIIFSDGTFTDNKQFWNREMKEFLRSCDKRKKNPVFRFAEDAPEDEGTNEDSNGKPSVVEIYWKDLTAGKQQEILDVFGDNCNYDVFPIIQIPVNPDAE